MATSMRRVNENGSMSRPTTSVVSTNPAIIMSHTMAAARPRRSALTRSASSASNGVPAALTPRPMITKASAAATSPSVRCVGTSAIAATASAPPKPSSAMPIRITGVRRPPASDQKPEARTEEHLHREVQRHQRTGNRGGQPELDDHDPIEG